MFQQNGEKWLVSSVLLLAVICVSLILGGTQERGVSSASSPTAGIADSMDAGDYVVLAWNDLGMHCYNRDFTDLAVLPPFNTLWAQVIRVGDPPQIVTTGITVTFFFTDNTY